MQCKPANNMLWVSDLPATAEPTAAELSKLSVVLISGPGFERAVMPRIIAALNEPNSPQYAYVIVRFCIATRQEWFDLATIADGLAACEYRVAQLRAEDSPFNANNPVRRVTRIRLVEDPEE